MAQHGGLTDAHGDVGRPLVVVLAGDGPLTNQLEAKLALEAKHIPVEEAVALPDAIQRRPRVSTALLVDFCGGHSLIREPF